MPNRIRIGENYETSAELVNPPAGQSIPLGSENASNNVAILENNRNVESINENDQEVISIAGQVESEGSSSRKRKRHTKQQIDVLEDYFSVCPHPDEQQRKYLSQELGLEPKQVKFWFQNKRTQTKSQHEYIQIQAENELLRAENIDYIRALSNTVCNICSSEAAATARPISEAEHHLRRDNKRLREEIERMKTITTKYVGKEFLESVLNPNPNGVHQNAMRNTDLLANKTVSGQYVKYLTEFCKANESLIKDLAMASLGELVKKIEIGEQIWIPNSTDGRGCVLKMDEYFKVFAKGFHSNPIGWKCEATMESAVVMVTPFNVVPLLMDLSKWLAVYSSIVSKAIIFHQLSTEEGETHDGVVQLMYAEFQTPCPIIPTRECIFLRYCKQLSVQTWAIVDVSLDSILPSPSSASAAVPSSKCLRWPSGCVIQQLPNGFSKVTWVEHVVVDDDPEVNLLAEEIVQSGIVYGAQRWISILERQSERLANATAQTLQPYTLFPVPGGVIDERKRLLKITERMLLNFYGGVTASKAYGWIYVSGDGVDEVKIMKRDNANVVSASLCQWLPISPTTVFDFIRCEAFRSQWDILYNGAVAQESVHIASGKDNENCVSVVQVVRNDEQQNSLIIQDSSNDNVVSSLIYAPVQLETLMSMKSGTSSDHQLEILPCGITVLPCQFPRRLRENGEAYSDVGSLLTTSIQFQISTLICPARVMDNNNSINIVKSIVQNAAHGIKNALMARKLLG